MTGSTSLSEAGSMRGGEVGERGVMTHAHANFFGLLCMQSPSRCALSGAAVPPAAPKSAAKSVIVHGTGMGFDSCGWRAPGCCGRASARSMAAPPARVRGRRQTPSIKIQFVSRTLFGHVFDAASRNGFFRWHAGLCAGGAVRDFSNRMRRRKSGTNRLPLRRGQVPGLAVLPRARASGYTTCRDAPEGGCMMLWKHSACAAGATIFPCRRQHTQPQVAHSLPPCLAGFLSNPRPFPGPRETGDVRGRAGQRANAWQGPNKSNAAHCW